MTDVPPENSLAPWANRVACWLIDAALPAVLFVVALLLPTAYQTKQTYENGVLWSNTTEVGRNPFFFILIFIAIAFVLWNQGFREGRTGKSIGKRLLGFTTLRESSGEPLGVTFATIRLLLLSVDFGLCYLGVLWPLWDPKRQCLVSDKATGSVVVRD